jgi:hypothetical protein
MVETVFDALGSTLTRWTMGGAAAAIAPSAWRSALGAEPEQSELRLLALSGQFIGLSVVAQPQGPLRELPDVPRLALPTLPAALRPLARRVLKQERNDDDRAVILRFLVGRGWTMHPADWMPGAGESDVPDVYAPWREWARGAASGEVGHSCAADELTAQTWDDYWPSARLAALTALRARAPDTARALLEIKLVSEDADARLRLLATLTRNLSEADVPFLETLADRDRAPKVKALAVTLLARLGRPSAGADADSDAAELAGFFELQTKGLLRRSRELKTLPPKTAAQKTRRDELLARTDLAAFAGALGLTPAQLGEVWAWGVDVQANFGFAGMAARSAPDDIVAALAERCASQVLIAQTLAPRLGPAQRAALALRLLRNGDPYQHALDVGGPACRIDRTIELPAGVEWLADLQAAHREAPNGQERALADPRELRALGLIASRPGAREALEKLTAAGLLRADPRLDMIRLNAALEDNGANI